MKKPNNLALGVSEPEKVADYLKKLEHPLKGLVLFLRETILAAHPDIGEGIYWNAPTFYFTGTMPPFEAKDYKRYIVGFNFYREDTIRLVFLRGAMADNHSGLLEGDYKHGRRIVSFKSLEEAKASKNDLSGIIRELVSKIAC